jgi:hypothetical protein
MENFQLPIHAILKLTCYQETPQAFTFSAGVLLVKKFVLTLSNAVHNLPGHLEASGQARRK